MQTYVVLLLILILVLIIWAVLAARPKGGNVGSNDQGWVRIGQAFPAVSNDPAVYIIERFGLAYRVNDGHGTVIILQLAKIPATGDTITINGAGSESGVYTVVLD